MAVLPWLKRILAGLSKFDSMSPAEWLTQVRRTLLTGEVLGMRIGSRMEIDVDCDQLGVKESVTVSLLSQSQCKLIWTVIGGCDASVHLQTAIESVEAAAWARKANAIANGCRSVSE